MAQRQDGHARGQSLTGAPGVDLGRLDIQINRCFGWSQSQATQQPLNLFFGLRGGPFINSGRIRYELQCHDTPLDLCLTMIRDREHGGQRGQTKEDRPENQIP